MRSELEQLSATLSRSGHGLVPRPAGKGAPGSDRDEWSAWVTRVMLGRSGKPIWLLPGMRLVPPEEANGILRAVGYSGGAVGEDDLPLAGDGDETCILLAGKRGGGTIAQGEVFEISPGTRPVSRAPNLAAWVLRITTLYAEERLVVDADGWCRVRHPGGT